MTPFLFYIARSGLYLAVFYAFYLLVMRRTTFFRFNRVVLLAGSAVCALLPLLRVRTAPLFAAAGPLTLAGAADAADAAQAPLQAGAISWSLLPTAVYVAGALVVLLITLLSARKIRQLAASGQKTRIDGFKTVLLSGSQPSFTFGKTIFISEKDLEANPAIFTHETMHVKTRHYLDLFLLRAVQTVWWWNPLVWIAHAELGLLHEYEADEGVIKQGIDAIQYQLLLVRKAVGEQRFSLASGFQHTHLKKRIAMMIKSSTSGWMRLAYLVLIPVLAAFVYACNPAKQSEEAPEPDKLEIEINKAPETKVHVETRVKDGTEKDEDTVPFMLIEEKPTFHGGDANEFAKWVNQNLKYPDSAKEAGIEGRVMVTFTVNKDGSMTNIRIVRGVHPDLDAEALRVMNSCTEKWGPGIQNGEPVNVVYTFPIVFQLR